MIIGAGSQFPRNNSHCVFQLQNGSGTTFTDTGNGRTTNPRTGDAHSTGTAWTAHTPTASEPFSSALTFDGTDDYLTFGASQDFNICNSDFTIEFYFKPDSTSASIYFLMGYIDTAHRWVVYLRYESSQPYFTFYTVDGAGNINNHISTIIITNAEYHHYAISNKNSYLYFAKDGIIDGNSYPLTVKPDGSSQLYIGSYISGFNCDGDIANLRIHKNIALWTRNFTPPNRAS